jgi:hypothetical protein
MWYRFSRDFSKYTLFENFEEVLSALLNALSNWNPENAQALISEFNSQQHIFQSTELQMQVSLRLEQKGVWAGFAEYYFGKLTQLQYIYLNVDYIFKFGQQFNENDVRRAIIHELQHAVEHNYDKTKLLSEKEQTKKQNWIESYHEKHPDNDRTLDVEYINTPTEIRATLAEIFASLDLPQNKETVKEELGKPTYENLKQLIENHERWGRFKYMSPKAIRYMIDELYKAIY